MLRSDIMNYEVGPCPQRFDTMCTDSYMVMQEQTSLSESLEAHGCDPTVAVKCCIGDCAAGDPWFGKYVSS